MPDQNSHELDSIAELMRKATAACDTAKTALRNRVSLGGDNFYGNKFHDIAIALQSATETVSRKALASGISADRVAPLTGFVESLCSASTSAKTRTDAMRGLKLLLETEIKPFINDQRASSIPSTERVLPLSVVERTRTYFEKVITQANGCYEHQWYDACSVMIRRFVETLIIELFEAKNIAARIKDGNGDFLMLQRLIDATLAEASWNLARETKRTLPLIKKLGDRSAHNRRYVATKKDVDEVIPGLRVVADDLLHLAGIK